jgi:hypothetical protein
MFSVDNFYTIFQSHYDWPRKDNIVYLFYPHGSKKWNELVPQLPAPLIKGMSHGKRTLFGKIVMHDQEPLFVESLNTYRDWLLQNKKTEHHNLYRSLDNIDLLHLELKSGKIPILCHSELNSEDVKIFKKNLFLDCYYWWHGMIARDWFRHWHYHHDLVNKDLKNYTHRFLLYSRDTTGTRKYRKQIIDNLRQNQHSILFDWNNDKQTDSSMSASICVEDAMISAIHLVAETLFSTNKIHLTEKVFKPMVMSQPFILAAPPNSLSYLKDYGFKTFESIWDESYDKVYDHDKRLAMIVDLVKQLIALSKEDFDKILEKCIPIIEHNRSWFYHHNFQNKLIGELHQNFLQAQEHQIILEKEYPGGAYTNLYHKMLTHKVDIPIFFEEAMKEFLGLSHRTQDILQKYPELSVFI